MDIFPYILGRLGGGSYEFFNQHDEGPLSDALNELTALRTAEADQRTALCDQLMATMQTQTEPQAQNAIQNLRRDIYNRRKLKNSKLNAAREVLPSADAEQLAAYLATIQQLKDRRQQFTGTFQQELATTREAFKKVANETNLCKGLVLSSQALLDRVKSYTQRDAAKFRKKETQVEQRGAGRRTT